MRPVRRSLYVLCALGFARLVRLLPPGFAVRCGGLLGAAAYALARTPRAVVERQLGAAFPALDAAARARISRAVFVNQGKNLFELFSFPALTTVRLRGRVSIRGREVFDQALQGGRGVLIAGAHCGNWELMGAALADAGYPVNVIARRIYLEELDRLLVGFRESKGMRVIQRADPGAAKQMLRALRNNESLALLIDQDTDVQGVFVDFFGRPAWTPVGLASLALRTGAAVILALDVREADDRHTVRLTGPFALPDGDPDHAVRELTRRVTAAIEEHVRAYPAQWVWMHERWRTVPRTGAA